MDWSSTIPAAILFLTGVIDILARRWVDRFSMHVAAAAPIPPGRGGAEGVAAARRVLPFALMLGRVVRILILWGFAAWFVLGGRPPN